MYNKTKHKRNFSAKFYSFKGYLFLAKLYVFLEIYKLFLQFSASHKNMAVLQLTNKNLVWQLMLVNGVWQANQNTTNAGEWSLAGQSEYN